MRKIVFEVDVEDGMTIEQALKFAQFCVAQSNECAPLETYLKEGGEIERIWHVAHLDSIVNPSYSL